MGKSKGLLELIGITEKLKKKLLLRKPGTVKVKPIKEINLFKRK